MFHSSPWFLVEQIVVIRLTLGITLSTPNIGVSVVPLFVSRAEPSTPVDLDAVLKEIYILYTDCALKDPFYELEMPIRCELFSNGVDQLIQKMEKTAFAVRGR